MREDWLKKNSTAFNNGRLMSKGKIFFKNRINTGKRVVLSIDKAVYIAELSNSGSKVQYG